ncbi:hypothetical protein SpCBS45565_g03242 [Spizellomyces sp. 'palustris']|nr:hypothetical protein SpCBS45565_g03242 [Spizellomyces sp. 'palustris']
MFFGRGVIATCFTALVAAAASAVHTTPAVGPIIPRNDHYNFHYFAVQLDTSRDGSVPSAEVLEDRAHQLGSSLGYHFVGRVGELVDYYLFATPKESGGLERRSTEEAEHEHVRPVKRFADEPAVAWVERQVPKRRLFRRAALPNAGQPKEERGRPLRLDDVRKELNIQDPGFSSQWHLVNTVVIGNDLNVTGVWRQGITGKNVTVCFVDDGLDYESPDLKDNFYAEGSYDFNDHVKLPKPKLPEDRHGTRCAGEVAAVRNDVCGLGVAYDAKVSGVRILSGDLTEADEAASINYDYQNNQIFSCSWGPADNGKAMEAPPKIVTDAVYNGITKGRGGLGSIYVFASGNGGALSDNCNFDGYTNSIYTITVGAVDRDNEHPVYSEACSAVMIVMYSSSGVHRDAIYTTDWPGQCTQTHGGTSAAAPLASGLYALVLQIRPDLTWRDIQHLTVQTAVPIDLDDSDWTQTAGGFLYNHKYGFGKLDGYALVEAAKNFTNVRPQTQLVTGVQTLYKEVPQDGDKVASTVTITPDDLKSVNMSRLEHITVTVNMEHQHRGDIEVWLTSPNKVASQLAAYRPYDGDIYGLQNWTFMTVKHWNENPVGDWTISVFDKINPTKTGTFNYWWMTFYGETAPPPLAAVPSEVASLAPSSSAEPVATQTQPSSAGAEAAATSAPPSFASPSTVSQASASSTSQPSIPPPVGILGSGSKSAGYAFAFGAVLLGAAGAGAYYFRRSKQDRTSTEQNYEFKMLNDNEIDAAFEEDQESQMRLVGGRDGSSSRDVMFDRFVLSNVDEDEDEAD